MKRLLSVLSVLPLLLLSGCQTLDLVTQATATPKSASVVKSEKPKLALNKEVKSEKPTQRELTNPNKILPIDYQVNEINSREEWFKGKVRIPAYSGRGLVGKSRCNYLTGRSESLKFLRSGNIIANIKTSVKYYPSDHFEFMDMIS